MHQVDGVHGTLEVSFPLRVYKREELESVPVRVKPGIFRLEWVQQGVGESASRLDIDIESRDEARNLVGRLAEDLWMQ